MTEPPASHAPDPLVGTVLANRYEILKRLGEGGMGSVYLAKHVHMGRLDAIKVLSRELAETPDAIERFRRGSANLSQINHDNVCRVYDLAHTPEGLWFLPMEYIDGRSLGDLMEDEGPMDVDRSLLLAAQMARGLHAAHQIGVVHRDMKPGNVMIAQVRGREVAKIVDFDIAKGAKTGAEVTDVAYRVGTPEYMSPEQLTGDELDGRSDLYSLGLTLFKMITGRLPLRGRTRLEIFDERLTQDPLKLAEVTDRTDLPDGLQELLDRLLARFPSDRPQSGGDLAGELERLHGWKGAFDRRSRPREPEDEKTVAIRVDDALPDTDPGRMTPPSTSVLSSDTGRAAPPAVPGTSRKWMATTAAVVVVGTFLGIWLRPGGGGVPDPAPDFLTRHLAALESGDLEGARAALRESRASLPASDAEVLMASALGAWSGGLDGSYAPRLVLDLAAEAAEDAGLPRALREEAAVLAFGAAGSVGDFSRPCAVLAGSATAPPGAELEALGREHCQAGRPADDERGGTDPPSPTPPVDHLARHLDAVRAGDVDGAFDALRAARRGLAGSDLEAWYAERVFLPWIQGVSAGGLPREAVFDLALATYTDATLPAGVRVRAMSAAVGSLDVSRSGEVARMCTHLSDAIAMARTAAENIVAELSLFEGVCGE